MFKKKENEKNVEMKYEKLTPEPNADISVYDGMLTAAFEDNDIRNIALSGPYGSGKSTIIQKFLKDNEKIKSLSISLAHFKGTNDHEETEKYQSIEGKIINQILYEINPSRIKQTRFKLKRDISNIKTAVWAIIVLFMLSSILFLLNKEDVLTFFSNSPYEWVKEIGTTSNIHVASGIAIMILLLATFFVLWYLFSILFKNVSLSKLKIRGAEIDLFNKSNNDDDSIFDKYIGEIVYLIDKSKADVIIFEDIDRFDSIQVLQRIREISQILNNRPAKFGRKRRVVKFIYLVKDSIFQAGEREKFFDFIIPVVPIVSSANSYSKLIELTTDLEIKPDNSLLKDISLYLDDFRIMKNIINELRIYSNALDCKKTGLDNNKLFSMHVYKALFPSDYASLLKGKGFVFNLFDRKQQRLEELIQKEDGQEKNDPYSNSELCFKPLHELLDRNNIDDYFDNTNEYDYTGSKITDQFIDSIKTSRYYPLLKYFIRNGFIDETYPSYLSFFYENGRSLQDDRFLRSITDEKALSYDYSLNFPREVLAQLTPYSFNKIEILNYDLFDVIILDNNYEKQKEQFIKLLERNSKSDFVIGYLLSYERWDHRVKVFNKYWPHLFYIFMNTEIAYDFLHDYAVATLIGLSLNTVKEINFENCLTSFISCSPDFLNIKTSERNQLNDHYIDLIKNSLSLLNVQFESINSSTANKELLQYVYENNLYQLNFKNIQLMLSQFYNFSDEQKIKRANFSIIFNCDPSNTEKTPLQKYVLQNLNMYFAVMLKSCDEKIEDTEESAIFIFNSQEISNEIKITYLNQLQKDLIQDISRIPNEFWKHLIEKSIAICNKNNVLQFFIWNDKELDQTLTNFLINAMPLQFDFKTSLTDNEENIVNILFEKILYDENLPEDIYLKLVFAFNFPEALSPHVPEARIKLLIEKNQIPMNRQMLESIRNHYTTYLKQFIINNFENYLTIGSIPEQEMLMVLSSTLTINQKLEALDHGDDYQIPIVGKGYPVEIMIKILENNMSDQDLEDMFQNYEGYPEEARKIIYQKATLMLKNENLKSYYNILSSSLAKAMLEDDDNRLQQRIDLLRTLTDYHKSWLTKDEIIRLSSLMNNQIANWFKTNGKKRIDATPEAEAILEILKRQGIIESFKQQANTNKFTIKRKKHPNKSDLAY